MQRPFLFLFAFVLVVMLGSCSKPITRAHPADLAFISHLSKVPKTKQVPKSVAKFERVTFSEPLALDSSFEPEKDTAVVLLSNETPGMPLTMGTDRYFTQISGGKPICWFESPVYYTYSQSSPRHYLAFALPQGYYSTTRLWHDHREFFYAEAGKINYIGAYMTKNIAESRIKTFLSNDLEDARKITARSAALGTLQWEVVEVQLKKFSDNIEDPEECAP